MQRLPWLDPANPTLIQARDDAQNAKNATAAALTTANNDVTTKTADQTAANAALATATTNRDNTAATATTDRGIADTAAATAAASLAITNQRQADWNTAITAKNAIAVRDQAIIYSNAAQALSTNLEGMRADYQKLVELQSQVDTSWNNVVQLENDLIAAKADPSFPSDQLPSMETALSASARNTLCPPSHSGQAL